MDKHNSIFNSNSNFNNFMFHDQTRSNLKFDLEHSLRGRLVEGIEKTNTYIN